MYLAQVDMNYVSAGIADGLAINLGKQLEARHIIQAIASCWTRQYKQPHLVACRGLVFYFFFKILTMGPV